MRLQTQENGLFFPMMKFANKDELPGLNEGELDENENDKIGKIFDVDNDMAELGKKIDEIQISNSNICFIIGGSYGISDEIKKMSNFKLSFSKMTFPHQLFRVILLEQLYRVYKINNNESYHK
jgi:rRNA large subunit m3Psi methyltransferase RlmH